MKLSSFFISLRVVGWLYWFDVRFLMKEFWDNLFDNIAWPFSLIFVSGYVSPLLGVPADYGVFISVSMLVIMGSYTAWTAAAPLAADLAGERKISYELTLPVPYWLVWIKVSLTLATKAAIFSVASLVIGKLVLWNSFSFAQFSLWRFGIVYIISCLFFGMFASWATVITKSVEGHSRLDLRLTGPMFYLNGWTASWLVMYTACPALGIFTLCTPWIYAYEGTRSAILGSNGYLPFWLCTGMLFTFTLIFALTGLRLFKKRMDCV